MRKPSPDDEGCGGGSCLASDSGAGDRYAGRMNQPLTITCERCGKPAVLTIELTDSWGSDEPTREDPVWTCADGHKTY
jgi:hypothetical protein